MDQVIDRVNERLADAAQSRSITDFERSGRGSDSQRDTGDRLQDLPAAAIEFVVLLWGRHSVHLQVRMTPR